MACVKLKKFESCISNYRSQEALKGKGMCHAYRGTCRYPGRHTAHAESVNVWRQVQKESVTVLYDLGPVTGTSPKICSFWIFSHDSVGFLQFGCSLQFFNQNSILSWKFQEISFKITKEENQSWSVQDRLKTCSLRHKSPFNCIGLTLELVCTLDRVWYKTYESEQGKTWHYNPKSGLKRQN